MVSSMKWIALHKILMFAFHLSSISSKKMEPKSHCNKEGLVEDPSDCHQFLVCFSQGKGLYSEVVGTCPKDYAFPHGGKSCVKQAQVKYCKPWGKTHHHRRAEPVNLDYKCLIAGLRCANAEKLVVCADGKREPIMALDCAKHKKGSQCNEKVHLCVSDKDSSTVDEDLDGINAMDVEEENSTCVTVSNCTNVTHVTTSVIVTSTIATTTETSKSQKIAHQAKDLFHLFRNRFAQIKNTTGCGILMECLAEGDYADPCDCTKYHTCIKTTHNTFKDIQQRCQEDQHFNALTHTCSSEDGEEEHCMNRLFPECTEAGILDIVTPDVPSEFFLCAPNRSNRKKPQPILIICPEDAWFDIVTHKCHLQGNRPRKCPREGTFRDPDSCSRYHVCVEENDAYVFTEHECTEGMYFSAADNRCEPAENVTDCNLAKETKHCIKEGKYGHPRLRTRYFVCKRAKDNSTLVREDFTCPAGSLFFHDTGKCSNISSVSPKKNDVAVAFNPVADEALRQSHNKNAHLQRQPYTVGSRHEHRNRDTRRNQKTKKRLSRRYRGRYRKNDMKEGKKVQQKKLCASTT